MGYRLFAGESQYVDKSGKRQYTILSVLTCAASRSEIPLPR